jgi:cytochrome d ubiquinol oxidase subunit II
LPIFLDIRGSPDLSLFGAAPVYPCAVPSEVTAYEAAAQPQTLAVTLWGVALVLPVVLGYTLYSYWVLRGKVVSGEGYH